MGRALVFAAAMAMIASPAHAQQQHPIRILPIHPPNPPMNEPHGYRHVRILYPTPEMRANNLAELLNLSADEKAQVLAVFLEQDKQTAALRSDESLPERLRMKKIGEVRDATVQKVRSLLTDEQKKQYDAIAPAKASTGKPRLEPDFSVEY